MTAPFRSKLIPYADFIRRSRAKRWSYPRIAQELAKQHGISVGASTIFDFVKVRARKRHLLALPDLPLSPSPQSSQPTEDGFFEPAPAPPQQKHERPKYNLDL